MKRSIILPAFLVVVSALVSQAQAPAARPAAPASRPATTSPAPATSSRPGKIAVVAFQEAVRQTNEFQRDFADLQKKWEPKRDALKKLNDDIESSTKALQTQSATLSDAERASRAKAIDDKKKQLQREAQDAQTDFQQAIQDLFTNTASKVYDVISASAQQNGYALVLDVADQDTPILYALPSTDITKTVIDAYNAKSGVPAPPPAAPAPAGQTPSPAAPKKPGQ
ncbi:MAG TPA: OmpH family outer membrane protein [Terracidiphilus sp.]|jgi:outer membrane protein